MWGLIRKRAYFRGGGGLNEEFTVSTVSKLSFNF